MDDFEFWICGCGKSNNFFSFAREYLKNYPEIDYSVKKGDQQDIKVRNTLAFSIKLGSYEFQKNQDKKGWNFCVKSNKQKKRESLPPRFFYLSAKQLILKQP